MNSQAKKLDCDLMIIGTGMAGMAAALFAARSGLKTVQAGISGQIGFASGLIDLLGVHPAAEGRVVENPWQGILRLCRDEPDHPYARMEISAIEKAVHTFLGFLGESGYPHVFNKDRNVKMPTPAGTLKPTYALPHTMARGPAALAEAKPCVIFDFRGLKGFSGRQIASHLAGTWPGLRWARLDFPEAAGELYTERMARALEAGQIRKRLISEMIPRLDGAQIAALPAVLGISDTLGVTEDIEKSLGVPVFEIPTMLPSVAGTRLQEKLGQGLGAMGVRTFFQHTVDKAARCANGGWTFEMGTGPVRARVFARAAVLCTGRFFGKGLHADRHGIRETVFDLPVVQPESRACWHHKDLWHPAGHPVNRAGLAVDDRFRPVDAGGKPVYPNLFAAGSILAHQDWMRQKCGSGLAIATAYGAVNACVDLLA